TIGDGSVIKNNTASGAGGGVAVVGGTLRMTGGSMTGNIANGPYTANQGGGAIFNGDTSTATLTDVTVATNQAPANRSGGAVLNFGTLRVVRGTMTGNVAAASGGAIGSGITPVSAIETTLTDATVAGNTAANYGGAIFNLGPLTINGGAFTGNQATGGTGG